MEIKIREYPIEKIEKIFSLYEDVFGKDKMLLFQKRFKLEYIDNPATKYAPSKFWAATREDGKVVGFIASFPMRLKVGDSFITSSVSTDLMVFKEGRRRGLGQKLSKAYRDSDGILATTFGYQPASGRIYRRLGYQPVYCEPIHTRPINLKDLYEFMVDSERLPAMLRNPVIKTVIRFTLQLCNPLLSLLNIAISPRSNDNIDVVSEQKVGAQYDQLWENVSPNFPVINLRDKAFVKWRFIGDPITSHELLAAYSDGSLKGYIALSITKRRNLPLGRIMDIFCDPNDRATISALLHGAIRYFEKNGAAIVSCLGVHPMIRNIIKKYLYLRVRSNEIPALFYYTGDENLKKYIFNADAWHVSYADGDEGFAP